MSKELEALNDMLEYLLTYDEFNEKRHIHNANIIETELKNYEELTNKPVILYGRTHGHTQALIDTICKNYKEIKITNLEDEKKLKALEIIARNCSFSFREVTKPLFEHYEVKIRCGVECIIIFIPPERKADYELLEEVLL